MNGLQSNTIPEEQESLLSLLQTNGMMDTNDTNLAIAEPIHDVEFLAYLANFSELSSDNSVSSTEEEKRKRNHSTRVGHCEHPKHVFYREEPFIFEQDHHLIKTIPRRGRPPKGSKPGDTKQKNGYRMVALTVRSLPKRLEAVVGRSNIKVCLTCLKKSDMDPEYLASESYIAPQQLLRRQKRK